MPAVASTVGTWTFADIWEAVADRWPDRPAQRCGDRTFTWEQFDRRADGVAQALVDGGLTQHAKVAQFLFNGPEYLEVQFACSKAGMVPVNTNYRYTGGELAYLWDNAEVEAVVFHSDLTDRVDEVRGQLSRVAVWLWVDAGDATACPAWATPYEAAATAPPAERVKPWPRDGQELNLLYTGGTTGNPKGVMWPQDTLIRMLAQLNNDLPEDSDTPAAWVATLKKPGPAVLPGAPLMHGTALWYVIPALNRGGCVVTLSARHLDVQAMLDVVVSQGVKGICIVGEAFARPLLDALDAQPDRWDLTGLRVIFTSGAIMRSETKEKLISYAPNVQIIDSLGSSESGGLARSASSARSSSATASFRVGPNTRVIDDHGHDVVAGSGEAGRVAIGGWIPVGYYRDEAKTAETFVEIDGHMHVVAGDRAEVNADGTLKLLGRGSLCINTGGEKVFPEEVEEALKAHPAVRDAVVVGLPHERFGEVVTAVVEAAKDADLNHEELRRTVRDHLAGYKVPRLFVDAPIGRAANGKADYRRLRALAATTLGVDLS